MQVDPAPQATARATKAPRAPWSQRTVAANDVTDVTDVTRVTYLGHATVMIESRRGRFLTDPVLRANVGPLIRHGPDIRAEWLERVDGVLISHLHHDHLDARSLRLFPVETPIVIPAGGAALLGRLGFARVIEVQVGDRLRLADSEVLVVPAAHTGHRAPFGPRAEAVGYVVKSRHSVYFAGDTHLFDEMYGMVPDLDVALLPVWGWGPRLGSGHMDPAAAAVAAQRLQPAVAIPIHWGALSLAGLRRFRPRFLWEPPIAFSSLVGRDAPEVLVRILEPGEALLVDWADRAAAAQTVPSR